MELSKNALLKCMETVTRSLRGAPVETVETPIETSVRIQSPDGTERFVQFIIMEGDSELYRRMNEE